MVWKALQFMVDGLKRQSERKDFKVAMDTFGHYSEGTCYGCAATCTIQEIAKKDLNELSLDETESRAQDLKFDLKQLDRFESFIDDARIGNLENLFAFMKKNTLHKPSYDGRFYLNTNDWESQLPKVEKLIAELKEKNI